MRLVACARGLAAGCLTSRLSRRAPGAGARPGRPRRRRSGGHVSWYTSTPLPLVQHLADKFTAGTGIKVTLLRNGGEAVLRRLVQEQQAGAAPAGADMITMSDAGGGERHDPASGLFVPFRPDGFDEVIDGAKDKDGRWIAQRVQLHRHAGAHRPGAGEPTGRRPGPIWRTPDTGAGW